MEHEGRVLIKTRRFGYSRHYLLEFITRMKAGYECNLDGHIEKTEFEAIQYLLATHEFTLKTMIPTFIGK